MPSWHLYIVRCRDGSLYCGVSVDVARRVLEHNGSASRASKYCWSRRPVELVVSVPCSSRGHALRAEAAFKGLPVARKREILTPVALNLFILEL